MIRNANRRISESALSLSRYDLFLDLSLLCFYAKKIRRSRQQFGAGYASLDEHLSTGSSLIFMNLKCAITAEKKHRCISVRLSTRDPLSVRFPFLLRDVECAAVYFRRYEFGGTIHEILSIVLYKCVKRRSKNGDNYENARVARHNDTRLFSRTSKIGKSLLFA